MYPFSVLLVVVVDKVLLDVGSVIALAGPMEPTTMLTVKRAAAVARWQPPHEGTHTLVVAASTEAAHGTVAGQQYWFLCSGCRTPAAAVPSPYVEFRFAALVE
jgi:ABC-type xylose transport system permease subunit